MGRRAFRRNDVIDQQSRSQTEPIPAATRNVHLDNATSGATFTRTVQPSPGQDNLLSRPVEDCEGCPALAGVRNLGLDDPSRRSSRFTLQFRRQDQAQLANHAEYGTRNREIEIWHVFGRGCGSGPPRGVAVHDEVQEVDDGLTTRALQEADSERLVDAGQVVIEVIPAAPHGDNAHQAARAPKQ